MVLAYVRGAPADGEMPASVIFHRIYRDERHKKLPPVSIAPRTTPPPVPGVTVEYGVSPFRVMSATVLHYLVARSLVFSE
jgi:hypothetical protein